jgi:hypothetical protein
MLNELESFSINYILQPCNHVKILHAVSAANVYIISINEHLLGALN